MGIADSPKEIALAIGAGPSNMVERIYMGSPVFDVRGTIPTVKAITDCFAAMDVTASPNQRPVLEEVRS